MRHEGQNPITQRVIVSASESVKRLNPHLFADSRVARLLAAERKQRPLETLERQTQGEKCSKGGMAESHCPIVRISLIAHRHRMLDSVNLAASFKAIQDEIAESFGVTDADSLIQWEYSQVQTRGQQGCFVKIERR